jgi:EAL domain-containing protein (putative c-di-GMP-specific phosphodiesterase class I)
MQTAMQKTDTGRSVADQMTNGSSAQVTAIFSILLASGAVVTFGGGWFGLIDWVWSSTRLPTTPPMNSIAMLLVGLAILSINGRRRGGIPIILAVCASVIGLLKVYLFWQGMLDAPVSNSNIVMIWLLSAAVILTDRAQIVWAQLVSILAIVHPLVSMVGYVYGVPDLILPMMAVYGSAFFAGVSILLRNAQSGPISHIFKPHPAGGMHRARLLSSILAIVLFSFLIARASLNPHVVSTLVTMSIALMIILAFDVVSYIDRSAQARYIETHNVVDLSLVKEIDTALTDGQLLLHFQPQIILDTGESRGVEALVRWRHPERGLVPPGAFIPAAELSGQIIQLGEWVLREACRQGMQWKHPAMADTVISVNVSPQQLASPKFVERVQIILRETGFPASRLVLELTESALVRRGDPGFDTLWELHQLGLKIAVDDFGTGYSCLSYLYDLPVDFLKIDYSFVRAIPGNSRAETIARTIVGMGHGLGLKIIAEGVERQEQADFLRRIGCDKAQGYFYAKPICQTELTEWMTNWIPEVSDMFSIQPDLRPLATLEDHVAR